MTTSTEVVKWKQRLKELPNDFKPDHHYWAAIIAEIRRGHVRNPRAVKSEDFLLKFKTVRKKEIPEDQQTKLQKSKNFWLNLTAPKPKEEKPSNGRHPRTRTPPRQALR